MDNRSIQRALRDIDVNDIVNAFAGANDYALEWYSYDETPGDYELKDFSIKRDREQLPGYAPFSEFYDQFVNTVLCDTEARKYISGVGFQWGGKHVIEQEEMSYPEMRFTQTENECGHGKNTWEHAEYVFGL